MKTISDLLGDHHFFEGLADDQLGFIAGCGRNARFRPGEYILREGAPADRFYVVRAGRVALEIDIPHQGPRILATVQTNQVLGVSWLLPPYRCTFDARAVEPVKVVMFDAACLRGKCDDDPVLGYELFKRFAGLIRARLETTRIQLLDLYGGDCE